ncbi:hypothetical protein EF903_18010 [Streptomyces sp. WAC05292]|nr:hypothetical protein EF903_18010 [Streptomyces sp. WAC05292]
MTTIPAPLDARLVTVEGSAYGPYVGLPLSPLAAPSEPLLFTRATAEQIVKDLHTYDAECGMTAAFANDGTLTFTWTAEYGGRFGAGAESFRPDAHGRYAIGGLWMWCRWEDCVSEVPFTAGQCAFAEGALQYRQADGSASLPEGLDALYARGREEANRVSLRPCGPVPFDIDPCHTPLRVTFRSDVRRPEPPALPAGADRAAARVVFARDVRPGDLIIASFAHWGTTSAPSARSFYVREPYVADPAPWSPDCACSECGIAAFLLPAPAGRIVLARNADDGLCEVWNTDEPALIIPAALLLPVSP